MKEERMKVLEMLENGKISAEEAQRLLELLTKPVPPRERAAYFSEEFGDKAEAFGDKVESAVKEFAQNLETMAKNVEPRLKKATQIIIEKTVSTVDEVSKAFHEDFTKDEKDDSCDCNNSDDDEPKEN